MRRLLIMVLTVLACCQTSAQATQVSGPVPDDSVIFIPFSTLSAWNYLDNAIRNESLWQPDTRELKQALRRLLDHTMEPFDTARSRLAAQDFSSVPVHTGNPVLAEWVEVKWINDSTFLVDPQGWSTDLYLKQETELIYPVEFSTLTLSDSILDENGMLDSALFTPDTIYVNVLDTAALESLEISLHLYSGNKVIPPLSDSASNRTAALSADLARVNYYDPSTTWFAGDESPFNMVRGEHHLDSLQQAVNALLEYTDGRDSTRLLINDMYGEKAPFWITTGKEDAYRFWVKNFNNDSITLWIGNPGPNEISLLLDDDVNFSRLMREEIHHLPNLIVTPDRSLAPMTLLQPSPIYWDYKFSSVVTLSHTYVSNWTKGGESSFAAMGDLIGEAIYNNKDANTQWISKARLKFGTIRTEQYGFRKNHDLFEIDSKFNRNAWGKIGMSASFYMKQQMAKGYDYPNDSVAISKFLNPGTLTIGIGAEYKPFSNTTINIAPFSYKTTFVLDTARIDQTKHGIKADEWAKRELGTQIVVYNKFSPFKGLDVANKIRLFSNYLYKPQNIDVDWEMLLEKKINWFFSIRLNLHLIYDDDIRFPVLDSNDQPVILPDGSEKQVAKAQFKEFIGLGLQLKF